MEEDVEDDEADEGVEVHVPLQVRVVGPQRHHAVPHGDQEREDHQRQDVPVLGDKVYTSGTGDQCIQLWYWGSKYTAPVLRIKVYRS